MGAELPECLACGACCFSRTENYVPVTPSDFQRLGKRTDLVRVGKERMYMLMEAGHCKALVVRAGIYACSTYETRPQICRDVARGSKVCRTHASSKRKLPVIRLGRG